MYVVYFTGEYEFDENGFQNISFDTPESAWREFEIAPSPAELYKNSYLLSPRGDFVKVGSELLFSKK